MGETLEAVERDLSEIAKRDEALAASTLAATAKQLARELDASKNSATSKGQCAKALMEAMERLRDLSPPEREGDAVDALADRIAAKLAGGAGA